MAISLDSYLNNYQAMSSVNQMKLVSQMVGSSKNVASTSQSLLDTYKQNNNTIKTLTKDSADFLKQYTTGMNQLKTAAGKLADGGVNKLLYDKEGNVTDDTVKNTVSAVKDMVTSYNDNLKRLNDNADRGVGVMDQMSRMVDDPAPEAGMKMVGVTVNDDGTLALDEAKLTEALKTEDANQRKLYTDILGDYNGIAGGVQKDARAGLNTPAAKLINNDVAKMQSIKNEDPIRNYYQSIKSGGAYALNNAAAMGIMMNMMA